MRKNVRLLICAVLAVAMLLGMSITGFAAPAEDALLSLKADKQSAVAGDRVEVCIEVNEENVVTDGKLTLRYDADKLRFESATCGEAWGEKAPRLSVNANTQGTLTLTFAASAAAAKADAFCLRFLVVKEGDATVELTGGYLTGVSELTLGGEITISAGCASAKYKDVNENQWYHDAVDFVTARGYMNGMSADTFEPNTDTSRAMVVTVLWRMAGSPHVDARYPFTDVANGQWYSVAVAWAWKNGIANGMDEKHFEPLRSVTREEMVTFLARYAKYAGADITPKGNLEKFGDASSVQSYARDYMIWAVDNGIIIGNEYVKLDPRGLSTRAMLATVVMRLDILLNP